MVNACRDHQRSSHRQAQNTLSTAEALALLSEEGREDQERRAALYQLLSDLEPPEVRETAVLLYVEGLSQSEAAEALDVKPGTIAWRASEIKRKLSASVSMERAYG